MSVDCLLWRDWILTMRVGEIITSWLFHGSILGDGLILSICFSVLVKFII